jgi:hypothetical protein
LTAVGLHPSLFQTLATYIAAGVLTTLFAGPGAGTAGAPLIIFGHRSIAAATAGGLVLSGTALLASALYAAAAAPVFLWRWHQTVREGLMSSRKPRSRSQFEPESEVGADPTNVEDIERGGVLER